MMKLTLYFTNSLYSSVDAILREINSVQQEITRTEADIRTLQNGLRIERDKLWEFEFKLNECVKNRNRVSIESGYSSSSSSLYNLPTSSGSCYAFRSNSSQLRRALTIEENKINNFIVKSKDIINSYEGIIANKQLRVIELRHKIDALKR